MVVGIPTTSVVTDVGTPTMSLVCLRVWLRKFTGELSSVHRRARALSLRVGSFSCRAYTGWPPYRLLMGPLSP